VREIRDSPQAVIGLFEVKGEKNRFFGQFQPWKCRRRYASVVKTDGINARSSCVSAYNGKTTSSQNQHGRRVMASFCCCRIKLVFLLFFQSFVQFSTCKSETLMNSSSLFVTNVALWARAIAAIMKSKGPIGVPLRSRSARIRP
jgi:hypothetical protein